MNRRLSPKEQKKLTDDARLLRAWKNWHAEQLAAAISGPHGNQIGALTEMLRHLAVGSSQALLDYVRSVDWSGLDYDHKLTLLHQINVAVTKLREQRGLEPISDPLWHQPDNVFRMIKSILTNSPHQRGGHTGG